MCIVVHPCIKAQENNNKIVEIINKFYEKYQKHQSVEYKEINYSENGLSDTLSMYFEKEPLDTYIGLRFEAIDKFSKVIYNTSDLFVIGLTNSSFYLPKNEFAKYPITNPFIAIKGYANSYPAYVKALKTILTDTNIKKTLLNDTIVNNHNCYQFSFHFENSRIMGDTIYVFPKGVTISFDFTFFIDKDNYLLRQMIFSNSIDSQSTSQYADYVFDTPKSNILWALSDYNNLKEYERYEYKLIAEGTKMPNFKAETLEKTRIDPSYFEGKVSLLFFLNVDCGAAKMTIGAINNLTKKYSEIMVIGIDNEDEDIDQINQYREKEKIDFKIAVGSKDIAKTFGVNSWPTILIFDKSNTLRYVYDGYYDELEPDIEKNIKNLTEE